MRKFEKYYKAVDFLEGLSNLPLHGDYLIDTDHPEIYTKRMRYFFSLIGNPDKGLKYIHIAGTSGKGTVTTMLHEIIHVSRKRVGSFTSPSVTTSIEKIRVGDKYISPAEFANIVEYLKPFIDQAYVEGPYGRPSYFEIVFAIAIIYFKKKECDWVVLEVGLGGRYDATNVIEKPLVTAITNIDFDHTEILGKTLQKIAFDKAGIIKQGSTFFTSEQRQPILKIFTEICHEKNIPLYRISHQDTYQKYNEALVTAIAQKIGLNNTHISQGIQNSWLPCRFETIENNPTIILDGAHNRSKIKTTIENLKGLSFKKLYLIIGIADNKDHASILKQIVPLADHIFFTRFQNVERKCAHPKALLEKSGIFLRKEIQPKIFLDPEQALSEAMRLAHADDLILITGSFFLVGELREYWYPEEWVLRRKRSI
jgi:dihydrofolate synthase/folylpolyglutamate synthase